VSAVVDGRNTLNGHDAFQVSTKRSTEVLIRTVMIVLARLAGLLLFKGDRDRRAGRQPNHVSFNSRHQTPPYKMMMAFVAALATVGFRKFDPAVSTRSTVPTWTPSAPRISILLSRRCHSSCFASLFAGAIRLVEQCELRAYRRG
jgi:hypothetical protein